MNQSVALCHLGVMSKNVSGPYVICHKNLALLMLEDASTHTRSLGVLVVEVWGE